MWTVIHITNSKMAAGNLKRALEAEGHLVQVRQTGGGSDSDSDGGVFEILVPESEVLDAHEVLTSRLGR